MSYRLVVWLFCVGLAGPACGKRSPCDKPALQEALAAKNRSVLLERLPQVCKLPDPLANFVSLQRKADVEGRALGAIKGYTQSFTEGRSHIEAACPRAFDAIKQLSGTPPEMRPGLMAKWCKVDPLGLLPPGELRRLISWGPLLMNMAIWRWLKEAGVSEARAVGRQLLTFDLDCADASRQPACQKLLPQHLHALALTRQVRYLDELPLSISPVSPDENTLWVDVRPDAIWSPQEKLEIDCLTREGKRCAPHRVASRDANYKVEKFQKLDMNPESFVMPALYKSFKHRCQARYAILPKGSPLRPLTLGVTIDLHMPYRLAMEVIFNWRRAVVHCGRSALGEQGIARTHLAVVNVRQWDQGPLRVVSSPPVA